MINDFSDETIAQARAVVLKWVTQHTAGDFPTNGDLARQFCLLLPPEVSLELRTSHNPSSLVYEARWYHDRRDVADFPKPFCAEIEADARILACAAMVQLG